MTKNNKSLSFLIFLFLLIPHMILADIIHLKSGGSVECVIESETDNEVTGVVNIGNLTYPKTLIESISRAGDEDNAKLKEKWQVQKQQQEAKQEEGIKFAAEQEAKGLILYQGQWIAKDEYEKLNKLKVKESKKVQYVAEPPITIPSKNKKFSSKDTEYKNLLGKSTLRNLKSQSSQAYYLYLPKDYIPTKKWPLFIGVHGYMADGNQAMDLWRGFADPEGFILACPSFKDGYQRLEYATDNRMIDIIKELEKEFRIDEKKVFMAGFSGGAQFTHRFVLRHPEYINSAVILAAGSYDYPANSARAKHIKFLVGVGANDLERSEATKKFAEQLKNNGYQVKFEIFPNVGHEVPPAAKQLTMELFSGMLKSYVSKLTIEKA